MGDIPSFGSYHEIELTCAGSWRLQFVSCHKPAKGGDANTCLLSDRKDLTYGRSSLRVRMRVPCFSFARVREKDYSQVSL